MGHCALIAYERPDSLYNLHYSHWGARNLKLKHAITAEIPFGSAIPASDAQACFDALRTVEDADTARQIAANVGLDAAQVEYEPRAVAVSLQTILEDYLDFRYHEAFYIVDRAFEVTAYRTHWAGLQDVCETVTDAPTIGNGVLRTVRWRDGEPVGDGHATCQFRGLKAAVGDMVDWGVLTPETARDYLLLKFKELTPEDQTLLAATPASG